MSALALSKSFSPRVCGVVLLTVLHLGTARPAHADAASCTAAHATGQRDMKAGHLRTASKQFMACASDEACPEAVRTDCLQLFESAERRVPTVIFSVVDEQGGDLSANVKVYSGEELVSENLDGRAVPFDPGRYQFRFVLPWGETIPSDTLIREGEKNRMVSITATDPNKAVVAEPPVSADASATPSSLPAAPPNRTPVGFWVASGVGVAALGTGAVFAILGRSTHSDLADCSPSCDPGRKDDYNTMKRNYLIGDIGIGAGLVSLGIAAIIYFGSGSSESLATEASSTVSRLPRVSVVPSREGASLVLSGATF